MSQPKYIVYNVAEVRKFAAPEAVDYLASLTTFIATRRREEIEREHGAKVAREAEAARALNRQPESIPAPNLHPPTYFVLKLSDPFAIRAMDHYIAAASESPEYGGSNGLKAAVEAAIKARTNALFYAQSKIPD